MIDLSNLLANATDIKITDHFHTSETFNEIIMPSMDFEDVNQNLCLVKEGLNPHAMEVYEFFGLLRLGATEGSVRPTIVFFNFDRILG